MLEEAVVIHDVAVGPAEVAECYVGVESSWIGPAVR
jgi:hypothetical protein